MKEVSGSKRLQGQPVPRRYGESYKLRVVVKPALIRP